MPAAVSPVFSSVDLEGSQTRTGWSVFSRPFIFGLARSQDSGKKRLWSFLFCGFASLVLFWIKSFCFSVLNSSSALSLKSWTSNSVKVKMKVLATQLCLTLCDPMDCSPPGSSVHGILQARVLESVAILFSRGSSRPRDPTWVSCTAGRLYHLNHRGSRITEYGTVKQAWPCHVFAGQVW